MTSLIIMLFVMVISSAMCITCVYIGYKLAKDEKIIPSILERKNKRVIRTPEEEAYFDFKLKKGAK